MVCLMLPSPENAMGRCFLLLSSRTECRERYSLRACCEETPPARGRDVLSRRPATDSVDVRRDGAADGKAELEGESFRIKSRMTHSSSSRALATKLVMDSLRKVDALYTLCALLIAMDKSELMYVTVHLDWRR